MTNSPLSDQEIFSILTRFRDILSHLEQANQTLLKSDDKLQELPGILDQRDLTLEMLKDLENEVFSRVTRENSANLGGFLYSARKNGRIADDAWEEFSAVLEKFQKTNLEIEEFLKKEKLDTAEILKKVRQGSSVLRGYAPAKNSQSCFIDKVK